jgi:hypothetical protein
MSCLARNVALAVIQRLETRVLEADRVHVELAEAALLCALRLKVGGRDFLMREVFEEFRVMPPGNLQVLADSERDKVCHASRCIQRTTCAPLHVLM